MPTQTDKGTLISDHHPSQLDKTVIWNIDYRNDKNEDIDLIAFSIAKKISEGKASAYLLQEVPDAKHGDLVKSINNYLKQLAPGTEVGANYQKNDTIKGKAGNLTLFVKGPEYKETVRFSDLPKEAQELKQFCDNSKGQALATFFKDDKGNLKVLVNVHAHMKSDQRMKIDGLISKVNALKKANPNCSIEVAGDFNAGKGSLPTELNKRDPSFDYKHSKDNSNYVAASPSKKRDAHWSSVDAFITSNKSSSDVQQLEKDNDYNAIKKELVEHKKKYPPPLPSNPVPLKPRMPSSISMSDLKTDLQITVIGTLSEQQKSQLSKNGINLLNDSKERNFDAVLLRDNKGFSYKISSQDDAVKSATPKSPDEKLADKQKVAVQLLLLAFANSPKGAHITISGENPKLVAFAQKVAEEINAHLPPEERRVLDVTGAAKDYDAKADVEKITKGMKFELEGNKYSFDDKQWKGLVKDTAAVSSNVGTPVPTDPPSTIKSFG